MRLIYGWHTADIRQIYGRKLKSWSLYKKQLLYPNNNNVRISFWPYISRIFRVCQPHISFIFRPHGQLIIKTWNQFSAVYPAYVSRISAIYQPYISRISAVYPPYVSRLSAVCQPSVSRISAVCRPYIRRMSAVCQPWNGRMSAVYQPYISRMSAVCQPYIRRMSAIPNLPICQNLVVLHSIIRFRFHLMNKWSSV